VFDNLIMDVPHFLSSTDIEVHRKATSITLSMTSSQNVEDVVSFFKKQLQKTQDQNYNKALEYHQLLIQSIHMCAVKFSVLPPALVFPLSLCDLSFVFCLVTNCHFQPCTFTLLTS
jgi:coatomer subunit beta